MTRPAPARPAPTICCWSRAAVHPARGRRAAGKAYEAVSLFGRPLAAAAGIGRRRSQQLEQARRDFDAAPTEDHYIWLGRRTAYVGRYREAIAIYTEGLGRFPSRTASTGTADIATSRSVSSSAPSRTSRQAAELVRGKPARGRAGRRPEQGRRPGIEHAVQHLLPPRPRLLPRARFHEGGGRLPRVPAVVEERRLGGGRHRLALHDAATDRAGRRGRRRCSSPSAASMPLLENGAYLDRLLMFKGVIPEAEFARTSARRDASGDGHPRLRAGHGGALARRRRARPNALRTPGRERAPGRRSPRLPRRSSSRTSLRAEPGPASAASTLARLDAGVEHYDLDLAARCSAPRPPPTYFSSEKPGRIEGLDASWRITGVRVRAGRQGLRRSALARGPRHPRGGGDAATPPPPGSSTATWPRERRRQRGPVTFVLAADGDGWRIAHAHFANDPPSPSK